MKYIFFIIILFSCDQSQVEVSRNSVKETHSIEQSTNIDIKQSSFEFLRERNVDQLQLALTVVKNFMEQKLDIYNVKELDHYFRLECLEGLCEVSKKEEK